MTQTMRISTSERGPAGRLPERLPRPSVPAQRWHLIGSQPMPQTGSPSPYRPTRREFLIGVTGLLVLAPYGCGTRGGGEGESGGTRTVQHAMGESEVPAEPGRIVALSGQMDLDALLALGLQPVAAGANFENDTAVNPWSQDRLEEDVEVFKFRPEPDVEQIATFEPDLVIGHKGWLEPVYDELSQLAPTVVTEYDGGVDGEGAMWRGPFRTVARAVGREERGEEILTEVAAEMERARGRLSELGGLNVSVFSALEGWQAYFTPESYPGYVLDQLGLSRPGPQTEIPSGAADPQQIEFSNERLDILDGDVAFCLNFGEDEFLDDWESRPLFQSLAVVESGNYVRLSERESNYWYYPTVSTPPLMLESLIGHLERLGFVG
ncbi:MAG: ABC transporter substrate-binding protein [Rubrobacteraceae bacterium]